MQHTVSEYMTRAPVVVTRYTSLAKAHALMRERNIRHLPVVDGDGVIGVVSRGDLHLLETIADFPLEAVDVEEAMSSPAYTVTEDAPVAAVVEAMAAHKYGCAIVRTPAGTVAGIFTTIDAMTALVKLARAAA